MRKKTQERKQKREQRAVPSAQQELIDKIEHARSLHKKAILWMQDWEKLYKNEFHVPADFFDQPLDVDTARNSSSLLLYKPSKAYSIVRKTLSLLSVRAEMATQVVPKNDSESEEKACTLLEQYLEGYVHRVQDEARRPLFRHAVLWALLRGKAAIPDASLRAWMQNLFGVQQIYQV
jgi:hypothetical protein